MSQQQPPPYGPGQPHGGPVQPGPAYGGAPTPYPPGYLTPPRPRRRRPSVVWFVVGGVLLVLAPVVFGLSLYLTLRPLAHEDAVLPADGSTAQVSVPAGEERALYREVGSPARCEITDGSGQVLEQRLVTGDFTYNEWRAVSRFDSGDGDLSVTCDGFPGSRVRIGELPSTGGFVGGLLAGILLPLALGLAGVLVLLVTTILFVTGRPRNEPEAPAPTA